MELSEDEIIKKYAKHCGHCSRNSLLPYKYDWTCFPCGFNLIKRWHELSQIQRKRINFIKRLKYAKHKKFCTCVDVYKIYEGNNYNKLFDVLSTLKNRK